MTQESTRATTAPDSKLTDERIEELLVSSGGQWIEESFWKLEDADLFPFARAIEFEVQPSPSTGGAPTETKLAELLRGLECGPELAQTPSDFLFKMGQMIAIQAKKAPDAGGELRVLTVATGPKSMIGQKELFICRDGKVERFVVSVPNEDDALRLVASWNMVGGEPATDRGGRWCVMLTKEEAELALTHVTDSRRHRFLTDEDEALMAKLTAREPTPAARELDADAEDGE